MRRATPFLLLASGCAVLFLGGLGRLPLLGRDESLYAEAAREMYATGDWVTPRVNGGPFFEKPPLHYWLAAASFRAFGVSPFAARLPAALMGLLAVVLTVAVGARVWGRRAGILAGLALATSLQVVLIARMGIMDVPLTCLVTLALLVYARWVRGTHVVEVLALGAAFGLCVGLALLLKGMAGLLPVGIAASHAAYLLVARVRLARGSAPAHGDAVRAFFGAISVFLAQVVVCVVAIPWFQIMSARHGHPFVSTLLGREHLARIVEPMQGHGGFVLYYLGVIAVSFFPWVVFLPTALFSRARPTDDVQAFWRSLLIVWFAVVLILFSLIRTKLPGYVTPLFPAMALLVGVDLDRRLKAPGRGAWIAVIVGAVVLAGLTSLLPTYGARLGEQVGAAEAAPQLIPGVAVWVGGYVIILVGALLALARRALFGLGVVIAGQTTVLAACLLGVLPVVSPYLEGGRESRLADIAVRELPGSQVVLYDTRAEAVAFVLGRTVPSYGREERQRVLSLTAERPTALIVPTEAVDLRRELLVQREWRVGNRLLLDVRGITQHAEEEVNR
jgi:4-amino-4-deoxy-L-arabinose transferase-like glycosyltransferase